jgi:mannan endo-1,6-alpha-mannosidase
MRLLDSLGAIMAVITLFSTLPTISAIQLDVSSPSSIKAAAKKVAEGMILWYTAGVPGQVVSQIPGYLAQLPDQPEYYWWEGGAMCGILMDYYYYTGDNSYNHIVEQAMMFQYGPTEDYMTPNVSKQEGNDDQMAWGFAAMTAAEYKFPNPPADKPQWLALAQGVWNSQQLRWDTQYCDGGLRWQIFTFNLGYDYKNTPSNAGFMNLGARLYAYTGNKTYADWSVKTWNWMYNLGYIGGNRNYSVFDGGGIDSNCTQVNPIQWTYSAGMLLNACAVMWNVTGDQEWYDRAIGIWNSSLVSTNAKSIS